MAHTIVFRDDVECLRHVSKLTRSGYFNPVLSHRGKAFAGNVCTRCPAASHGEISLILVWTAD